MSTAAATAAAVAVASAAAGGGAASEEGTTSSAAATTDTTTAAVSSSSIEDIDTTTTSTKDLMMTVIINKNFNIYWLTTTMLAVWFLFVHSPPLLKSRNVSLSTDAPFVYHLIGSYSIYITCIINTLITPSIAKFAHVYIGRIGMILGVLGFIFGLYLSWYPHRPNGRPPLEFSIGITIGGIAQILLQFHGYKCIKQYQTLRDDEIPKIPHCQQQQVVEVKEEEVGGIVAAALSSESKRDRVTLTTTATSIEDTRLLLRPMSSNSNQPSSDTEDEKDDYSNNQTTVTATVTSTLTCDHKSKEDRMNKALGGHISSMISLFVIACTVPGAIRLADVLLVNVFHVENADADAAGTPILIALIVIMSVVSNQYTKIFRKRIS